MTKLSELLFPKKPSRSQKRATELAKADYRLLMGLIMVRKDRGLSQQDVADKLGLSQPTIAAFERMDSDPKLSTIRRYAHAVEAVVTHNVVADRGQFDGVADWSAPALDSRLVLLATFEASTYQAAHSKRLDFALVA